MKMAIRALIKGALIIFLFFYTQRSVAQSEAAELAKKLANPISSLISVPFQNNTDYGIGDSNGTRNTLNVQPVVPFALGKKLNLITRIIMPVITQYDITSEGDKQSGLGDFVLSGFFSPAVSKNGFTWGAGPVFLLPVGTNDYLTNKKFGIGPTVVALKQSKGFTYGALVNQIWSIAGEESRPDVNQFYMQLFFTYNWKTGAGLNLSVEDTENWQANTSTLFLTPMISGVTSLGKQKVQLAVGPRINVAAPSGGSSDWGWRAIATFLFPKK